MFMCKRKRDEDMIIMQGIMCSKLFIQLFLKDRLIVHYPTYYTSTHQINKHIIIILIYKTISVQDKSGLLYNVLMDKDLYYIYEYVQ